jgi:hypothetical protein
MAERIKGGRKNYGIGMEVMKEEGKPKAHGRKCGMKMEVRTDECKERCMAGS